MADPRDRVPPGQVLTNDWPVLHYGSIPPVNMESWKFRIFGEVAEEVTLTYPQFMALPQTEITVDIHCVTHWSRLDNRFKGVPFQEVMKLAQVKPEANHVVFHAVGGWTTNVPLEDCLRDDVIFAYQHNGQDISPAHGWPLRGVVPHLYFWKSAKWVSGIEFVQEDRPGFWERNGYHMYGDPWKNQRYDDD